MSIIRSGRRRLIPHRRDVIEDQAKVLTFPGSQGSGADRLRVHVGIAGADEAERCLQYLGSVAGLVWEGGLEGHGGVMVRLPRFSMVPST